MTARATLPALASCAEVPPARASLQTTPFAFAPAMRSIVTPWERSPRDLDFAEQGIVRTVVAAAASLIGADQYRKPSNPDAPLQIWWINSDGAVLNRSTVDAAWWAGRTHRFMVLELVRRPAP